LRKLSSEQRFSLESRAAAYHRSLFEPAGAEALAYWREERGLTPETIARFRLGYVESPGASDDMAQGMLSIPFTTPTGVVAIRFRQMPGAGGPKYWQPEGSKIGIFNTPAIAQGGRIIVVVEGEVDAMTAGQCGLPAVGYPGASSGRPHHKAVYEGYERTVVIGDNDDKEMADGKRAGAEFVKKVAANVPNPEVHMMPAGHDVNSAVLERGAEWLWDHLKLSREDFN
jgi:DNA primase